MCTGMLEVLAYHTNRKMLSIDDDMSWKCYPRTMRQLPGLRRSRGLTRLVRPVRRWLQISGRWLRIPRRYSEPEQGHYGPSFSGHSPGGVGARSSPDPRRDPERHPAGPRAPRYASTRLATPIVTPPCSSSRGIAAHRLASHPTAPCIATLEVHVLATQGMSPRGFPSQRKTRPAPDWHRPPEHDTAGQAIASLPTARPSPPLRSDLASPGGASHR